MSMGEIAKQYGCIVQNLLSVAFSSVLIAVIQRYRLHNNMKAAFIFGSGNRASFEPNHKVDHKVHVFGMTENSYAVRKDSLSLIVTERGKVR